MKTVIKEISLKEALERTIEGFESWEHVAWLRADFDRADSLHDLIHKLKQELYKWDNQ